MPQIIIPIVVAIGTAKVVSDIQTKKVESAQKKAAAAAESSQRDLAGEAVELNERQMALQIGQRKITSLEDALTNQEGGKRILTLPSQQTLTMVDRINLEIDSFLRGEV